MLQSVHHKYFVTNTMCFMSFFSIFSLWIAKNGSYLLRSSVILRKFLRWSELTILPCTYKPHVLTGTITSMTRTSTSRQYLLSNSVVCTYWRSVLEEVPRPLDAIAICCVSQFFCQLISSRWILQWTYLYLTKVCK